MKPDHAILDLFAAALLDPAQPPPSGLAAWNGSDPEVRFGVYRNNVVVSLVAALAETFPVTQALVGEAFFQWMAHQFIAAEPPRSPVLTEYGDAFPAFVAAFAPAAALGYLPVVARLERLRVRAYHAADAEPLATARLVRHLEQPERLPGARLRLHPALAVIRSAYPVVSLWAAHQGSGRLAELSLDRSESALVLRGGDAVAVLAVPEATAVFVAALASGMALGEAAAVGALKSPSFDPTQGLALLIHHGAIVAWQPPGALDP